MRKLGYLQLPNKNWISSYKRCFDGYRKKTLGATNNRSL